MAANFTIIFLQNMQFSRMMLKTPGVNDISRWDDSARSKDEPQPGTGSIRSQSVETRDSTTNRRPIDDQYNKKKRTGAGTSVIITFSKGAK